MTTLAGLTQNRVIPLQGLDGFYLRDLPAHEFEPLLKHFAELPEEEDADIKDEKTKEFIAVLFTKYLCDKDCEQFTDTIDQDYEGLSKIIPITLMWDILYAIPEAIVPSKATTGN